MVPAPATHERVAHVAWWYWRWRTAFGVAGDATGDWLWAEAALTEFPLVTWLAGHSYSVNWRIIDPNNHNQIVTGAGISGSEPPVWRENGGFTEDGTVTWLDMGAADGW